MSSCMDWNEECSSWRKKEEVVMQKHGAKRRELRLRDLQRRQCHREK